MEWRKRENRERKNEEKRDTDLERPRERNRKRGKGREWRKLRRDAEVVQLEGSGDDHLSRENKFNLVLTDARTTLDQHESQ